MQSTQSLSRQIKAKSQGSRLGGANSELFAPLPTLSSATFESAAFTSTSAIFSIGLTMFTLSALYQGLQNIALNSSKQMSLRNQTFFCILVPIVIIYYTKLTLEDYIKSLFSKHYNDENWEELNYLTENSNIDNLYKNNQLTNPNFFCAHSNAGGSSKANKYNK